MKNRGAIFGKTGKSSKESEDLALYGHKVQIQEFVIFVIKICHVFYSKFSFSGKNIDFVKVSKVTQFVRKPLVIIVSCSEILKFGLF